MASMKKSQLREYIRNYINEIRLKSVGKGPILNVFRVEHNTDILGLYLGAVYFNHDGVYEMIVANLVPGKDYIGFLLQSGTKYIDLINVLKYNNIPFEKDSRYHKLNIPLDYINFIDVQTLNNIPKNQIELYSNEYELNEIRLKSAGKGGAASISTLNLGDIFSITKDAVVAGSISDYVLSAKKYRDVRFLVVKINPKRIVTVALTSDNKMISWDDARTGQVKFPTSILRGFFPNVVGYEKALEIVKDNGIELNEDGDIYTVIFKKSDDVDSIQLTEVRLISSKSGKLKAFKARDGSVTIYYKEPGSDWFSQVIQSNYGKINPKTDLVEFSFWSDDKMTEFEDILDYSNIVYDKENDMISIQQSSFDFIEKALGPNMKDVEDNEWYNDRIK